MKISLGSTEKKSNAGTCRKPETLGGGVTLQKNNCNTDIFPNISVLLQILTIQRLLNEVYLPIEDRKRN
jgi:hypothetical protein